MLFGLPHHQPHKHETLALVLQANFARSNAAQSKAQATRVPRFLPNPEQHWGPKPKAGRRIGPQHASLMGEAAVNGTSSLSTHTPEGAPTVVSGQPDSADNVGKADAEEEGLPAAKRAKLDLEPVGDS